MKQEIDQAEYDVFISYAHQDRRWVQDRLLPRLEEAGLKVCIDLRNFEVGVPVVLSIEKAVAQSRFTLLALSPDYLHDEWAAWEVGLVNALDSAERQRRVIPLLLRPCELPMRIATLSCVDFTRPNQRESQLKRLLAGLGAKAPLSADGSLPATTKESSAPATEEPREFSVAAIRRLLADAMSDEELTAFCFDYFRDVYEDFAVGMSKTLRIQVLLDYCVRRERVGELLAAVQWERPYLSARLDQLVQR